MVTRTKAKIYSMIFTAVMLVLFISTYAIAGKVSSKSSYSIFILIGNTLGLFGSVLGVLFVFLIMKGRFHFKDEQTPAQPHPEQAKHTGGNVPPVQASQHQSKPASKREEDDFEMLGDI